MIHHYILLVMRFYNLTKRFKPLMIFYKELEKHQGHIGSKDVPVAPFVRPIDSVTKIVDSSELSSNIFTIMS